MIDLLIIGGDLRICSCRKSRSCRTEGCTFEKSAMGGVCLNEGCIPTKTLLYSAKTYENALHGDSYGVFGDNIRFDYGKMLSRKKKVVRKLVLGVEGSMKKQCGGC